MSTKKAFGAAEKKAQLLKIFSCENKVKQHFFPGKQVPYQNREADILREELVFVHNAYKKTMSEKNEEIKSLRESIDRMNINFSESIESMRSEMESMKEDLNITEGELSILQNINEEWIGRTLKLKYVFDQIQRINALPEDHVEWVKPMIDEIEIPEVSISIKEKFIPTVETNYAEQEDEWSAEDMLEYLMNDSILMRLPELERHSIEWLLTPRAYELGAVPPDHLIIHWFEISQSSLLDERGKAAVVIQGYWRSRTWGRRQGHTSSPQGISALDMFAELPSFDAFLDEEGSGDEKEEGEIDEGGSNMDYFSSSFDSSFNPPTVSEELLLWGEIMQYNHPRAILEKSARVIQKYWSAWHSREK